MFGVTQFAIVRSKDWVGLFFVLALCIVRPLIAQSDAIKHLELTMSGETTEPIEADLLWSQETTSVRDEETASYIKTAGQLVYPNFLAHLRVAIVADKAPRSLRFRLHRARTNETEYVVAKRSGQEASGNTFIFEANWNITRKLGQWRMTIDSAQFETGAPRRLNSTSVTYFQIDKRQQIVELGRHWTKLNLQSSNQLPLFNACDGFVGYIYAQLGLPKPDLDTSKLKLIEDEGLGSMHYFSPGDDAPNLAHISIQSGAHSVIDNNWGNSDAGPQEHLDKDVARTYYSWASFNYSPEDPNSPGRSLLDTN